MEAESTLKLATELSRIFSALVIHSPFSVSFAGQTHKATAPVQAGASDQSPLTALMQSLLYQHAYCNRFTGVLREPGPAAAAGDMTAALAAAHTSRERWVTEWQVVQVLPSGQLAAQRYGVHRLLWPGEFLAPDAGGRAPRSGSQVNLFWKRDSATLQPGFYFAFGETVPDHQDEGRLIRLYWHIGAKGAAELLRQVSAALNRFQIPFRFKCLSNPAYYARADAAVLFISKRFYCVTSELLTEIYPKLSPELGPETPLFAKRLAPGLAVAEDPATGESFGMSRCRLVAQGVVNAYLRGSQTNQGRFEEVQKQFEQGGFTLEHPHLNPGSIDLYTWPAH